MPNFFSGVTGRSSATLFEIRLDNDIIVLRGPESQAASQILKGTVVLCLPSPMKVEDVHLRMTGHLKIGWNEQRMTAGGLSTNRMERSSEIFCHRWPALTTPTGSTSSSRGTLLEAGNWEWPFEMVIPGTMAESVEGMPESHIIYKLKATVARGKLAHDLHAWKPVRIVRTLDPSALELAHAMTVENVWPNKIEYSLLIPQKAIVFGTAIEVEMRFTSLLKGLKIGNVKCQLVESRELTLPGATPNSKRTSKTSRTLDAWTFEVNEGDHYREILNEDGQDGYLLTERMPLPRMLSKCMQDVEVHGIKIRHKVKFNIALHNPDGHISELRATLPVTIFISPNMPLTADGCLVDQAPTSAQAIDMGAHAPPLYGEHLLDQIYEGLDNSGIMTPAPQSGVNSPMYNLSRAGSSENVAAIGSMVDATNGAFAPAALSTRLHNLNVASRNNSFSRRAEGGSEGHTPLSVSQNEPGNLFSHHYSDISNPMSRRGSDEEDRRIHPASNITSGQHSPEHIDFSELGDLTKVPSYATALKTPVRGMSLTNGLPNYDAAVSAPPSPEPGFSTMSASVGTPPEGDQATGANNGHHPSIPRNMMSGGHLPSSLHHSVDVGERRRLDLLRHRQNSDF